MSSFFGTQFSPQISPLPPAGQMCREEVLHSAKSRILFSFAHMQLPMAPAMQLPPAACFVLSMDPEHAPAGGTVLTETPSSIAVSVGAGSTSQRADFGSALAQPVVNSAEFYGSIWMKRSV